MNSYIDDSKLVLINVFAEHDYIYNLDFYLNVVKHYKEKGFKVLFVGVEKNRIKVDKFLIKNGIGSNSNLLGKTNIDELYYLLSKSKLLITIDTGVRHLANCLELPIISFRKTPNYDSEFGKYLQSETIYNEEHNRLKYANTSNSVEKLNYKMLCKEFN
jgi:ADP-heptose:LPS heptosyltransferase